MKKYRTSILCIALLTAAAVCLFLGRDGRGTIVKAQQTTVVDPGMDAMRDSINTFFDSLSETSKGPRKAVEDFVKNSPLADNEKTRTKIVEGLQTIGANFGDFVAYEMIGVKHVGTDLVVFRYLYKCQEYPVVWYFTFYCPRAKDAVDASSTTNSWNLIGLRYDTNLDAALLDATF